jgi:hypothetical protein
MKIKMDALHIITTPKALMYSVGRDISEEIRLEEEERHYQQSI